MEEFKQYHDFGLWSEFEYDFHDIRNISELKKKIEFYATPVFYLKESNHTIDALKYIKYRLSIDLENERKHDPYILHEQNLLQVINWLDNKIWELERSNYFTPKPVKALVLYYYYIQLSKEEPDFSLQVGGKRKALADIAEKRNIGVGSFRNLYYKLSNPLNRLTEGNIDHIKQAVEILHEYPKAQGLAKKELISLELKFR